MGEFADMLVDDMWDRMGEDNDEEGPFPITKTCRYCGQEGLRWHLDEGAGWRLWDDNSRHVCEKYKKPARV